MKYKATISFVGSLCMAMGERVELSPDSPITKDLLNAGYIKPVRTQRRAGNDADKTG